MLNEKVSRSLRMMLVVLALGVMLSVSGCSSLHRKKPVAAPGPVVTPPTEAPISNPPNRPAIGSTEEFPESAGVNDVHFDFDKSNIKKGQLAILDKNLEYFKSHPEVKIMLEGHTDERGTVEYNFALGQRRASAVQDYLLKNGIAADRLATVSKGEEAPVDPAHSEAAWGKNRRVHFLRMY